MLPSYQSKEDHSTESTSDPRRFKDRIFRVLAVVALVYASFYGLRRLFRSPHGNILLNWKGCHTPHRNSSTATELPTHYTLPSGDKIPSIALGVWRTAPNQVSNAVKTALKKGYRHIDGAWIYGNEEEVGRAIRGSNISRSEIWLTSKLWNAFHIPDDIESTLDESLANLGTDYIDLYLIHWPVAFDKSGNVDVDLTEDPYPTWQKLEELVEKGKIRNIGVSNFNIRRLNNLTANPLKFKPAVNQVELNFWLPQPDLLKWSKENNVILEAYSPLGSSERVRDSLSVPEIQEVAAELGLTPAQVLISWHVQRGTVVLPKAGMACHVKENFKVTALPQAAFEKIEKAATSHEPQRGSDPSKKWGVDIFD